ncbi:MAG: hypothetical protein U0414_17660 [Polyangiaceae bacterium]
MRSIAMAFSVLSVLSSTVLVACDDGATTSTTTSSSSSTGSGGAGGGTVGCADPEATSDMPCGTLAIAASDIKSRPRNHHVTLLAETAAGPFLYAIGGANGNATLKFVDRFPIQPDGSLGPSIEQSSLPVGEGGMTGGLVGKTIVIAGGTTLAGVVDSSYYATVGDDGTLSAFTKAGSVLHKRMHPGAVVKGDTIWVMGGFKDPDVWDDIVKATVGADGVLGEWTSAGLLPGKRSHFAVTRVGDDVYLTGGLDKSAYGNPPDLADTWHGRFAADGTIGEWTKGPDLPVAIVTHSSFFYGGYIYVGGGIRDKPLGHEDRLWRAPIQADRSLGAWEEVAAKFGVKRGHVHQYPMFENHFYSISGAIDFNLGSTDEIDIGTFQP